MNESAWLLVATGMGAAAGVIFFGGLWWTVKRALPSPKAALWIVGSLLVRMTVALTGFYAVGGSHWQRLLLCLLGFLAAREAVLRLTRPERKASCD